MSVEVMQSAYKIKKYLTTKFLQNQHLHQEISVGFLYRYTRRKVKSGLNHLVAKELEEKKPTDKYNVCNLMWTSTKFLKIEGVPSWKSFMEKITRKELFKELEIIFLCFINQPPSNYNTLYSATKFAIAETNAANKVVAF